MKTFLKIDLAIQSLLIMALLALNVWAITDGDKVYIVWVVQLYAAVYLIASGISNFFTHGNFGRYRLYNIVAGIIYLVIFLIMLYFLGIENLVLIVIFYTLLPQALIAFHLWLTHILIKEEQTIIDKSSILF
jgi:hypothetical protein